MAIHSIIRAWTCLKYQSRASLVAQLVKKIYLQCRRPGFDPWVGKIPCRRERLPTPVFWPREFCGLLTKCAVFSCSVMSNCFSVHGNSLGKNNGVDCHALLQGIFPTQGSNPGLLHCRQMLYCLSYQESPMLIEGTGKYLLN